jgi:hypothetical protein
MKSTPSNGVCQPGPGGRGPGDSGIGEETMSHNIANLEHHHFKYDLFRQPGDVHVHFFGTSVLSFADHIKPAAGDVFEIESGTFGKALRNPLTGKG